jgi:hypothetical protein
MRVREDDQGIAGEDVELLKTPLFKAEISTISATWSF